MATPNNVVALDPRARLGAVARRLDEEAARAGVRWWRTTTAVSLFKNQGSGRAIAALAAIAEMLGEGEAPLWVVGGETAVVAAIVATEWLDAGMGPREIAGWLRAGCSEPQAASEMTYAGLCPTQLVDDQGVPLFMTVDGRHLVPVAMAVADGLLSPSDAARLVAVS